MCKNHAREVSKLCIGSKTIYSWIWNFDMVSFWLKPFKPPTTQLLYKYLFLKDVTLLIEDLYSLWLLGATKTT